MPMASIELFTEISAALLAMEAVTAIVGHHANGDPNTDPQAAKIWNSWERAPQVPCIVIDVDSEDSQNDLGGRAVGKIATVTVTCRANTHADSDALADAVETNGTDPGTGLAGYEGTFFAVHERTVHSETPKGEGSSDHWYDHVMEFTVLF